MNREIGIRMVKTPEPAEPECVPQIEGLFLQDWFGEWKITEKYVLDYERDNYYTFELVRLLGDTCGQDVTWRTDFEPYEDFSTYWKPLYYFEHPVFYGHGALGVVGYKRLGRLWPFYPHPGVIRIWATVGGQEYGPVTLHIQYEERAAS